MKQIPAWTKGLCLIYGRCSKAAQDDSLADQERSIRRFMGDAKLNTLCDPFEDDARRGHDEERPGLLAVLDYTRRHPNPTRRKEDYIPVLVYCVARFGRFDDPKKFMWYATEIERNGYEFYSVEEGIRSRGDLEDFIMLLLKGQQAYEFTLDLSTYGIRTGCSLASRGWWPGGNPPYGYDRLTFGPDGKPRYRYETRPDKCVRKYALDGTLVETFLPIEDNGKKRSVSSDKLKSDKVRLVPNPEHAPVVKRIFDWFVMEGFGLKKIASKLNAEGIPAPRGRKWLKASIRIILRNPAYKGAIAYGRRSDGKHHDVEFQKVGDQYAPKITKRDQARREFVNRPLDQCVVREGCHDPIIAQEVWDVAEKRLQDRKLGKLGIRGRGARGSSYLLSGDGLIKCSRCGYRFQGSTDRKSHIRYYLDGGYHAGGKEVCGMTLVRADDLERSVSDLIAKAILGGALFENEADLVRAIEQELESGTSVGAPDPEVDVLAEKLASVRRKLDDAQRLAKDYGPAAAGLIDQIRNEESAIASALREKRGVVSPRLNPADRHRKAAELARQKLDLTQILAKGTPDEKKRFVRDFIGSIEVDGKTRKVRIAVFDGGDAAATLRGMPPTGFEPVSRA